MEKQRTIHFIYATPYSLLDKITMRLFKRKLCHPSLDMYNWPVPLKAPLSITYQIAKRLAANYQVKLYHLKERIVIEPEEGDILLGHLWPDPKTVMYRSLENNKFSMKCIVGPYNHDVRQWSSSIAIEDFGQPPEIPQQVLWAYKAIMQCDKYFAICGRHWIDTFKQSPFASLKEKIVHVNMAIDTDQYPMVKTRFNQPGKRKFFYIGRHAHEKGTDLLEQLAESMTDFEGGYICPGRHLKGWKKISDPTELTPEFMKKVAEEYDVFINMSRADAQATTVLEAMSWGFPVACTRESGYADENFFYLDLQDEKATIETLRRIQQMSNAELEQMALENRKVVEDTYCWSKFVSKIEKTIADWGK